jgi:tetratricopeptide (TPR) repeat protein
MRGKMILNYEHFRSGRKRGFRSRLIPILSLVLALAIAALFIFGVPQRLFRASGSASGIGTLSEQWKNERYDDVIAAADEVLKSDPLNVNALCFRGFASFYKAVSDPDTENRIPLFDDAVKYLRRARAVSSAMPGETAYVLGKSYYYKGRYYYDLSIAYMSDAIQRGFVEKDSYEYLGMACYENSDYEKAIPNFLKALDQVQSDFLLLTIGQTYYQMKRTGDAVDYLLRALNKTEDKSIEKQVRFLLGDIYLDGNELFKAEEQYSALIRLDPRSADAHFYLGEVYAKMNDVVKARAEWRAAFRINPKHAGANLRLFH